MVSIETRLRVRFAETDQMGIVYYANYFIWMELGRVEWCRARGVRYRDMEADDGILLTVAEAACRYLSPARYDEEVAIQTEVRRASPRLVEFTYVLNSAETGLKLATGSTTHVFCGRDLRPTRLPEKYRGAFGIS
jgi:acyl-CoA thioester hydrolase